MVQKRTCDYTGEEIEPGTGIMYVKIDGTVLHFVDSKAEKNYKLGREPRDLEWTEAGQRVGDEEAAREAAREAEAAEQAAADEADDEAEADDEEEAEEAEA